MSRKQINSAVASGNNIAKEKSAEPGLVTSTTPVKPTSTAHHRAGVTRSLSIRAAAMVRNIGDVQTSVEAVAIGKRDNPVIKQIVPPHSHNALTTIHLEITTSAIIGLPFILNAKENIATAINPRMNSI